MSDRAGWDWCLPMLGYGDEMHQQRKLMNACLNANSIRQYHALMTKETRDFCMRLLKDPKKHLELNRRCDAFYQGCCRLLLILLHLEWPGRIS